MSNILLSDVAPKGCLKQRLSCKTFRDVMEFYEHRLNVVCWKTKQFTMEDALLSTETAEDARSVSAHRNVLHGYIQSPMLRCFTW